MSRPAAPQFSRDDGFTLVELMVAIALFSLVMIAVGGVLISSLRADSTVRSVTTSTTDGQLAVSVIQNAVRNSSAVFVEASDDGDSFFATVRTVTGSAPRCVAWFYDATDSTLYQQQSTSEIDPPEPGSLGGEWTAMSSGIVADVTAAGVPQAVFEAAGTRGLNVRFTAEAEIGAGSLFSTTITGQAPPSNESPQCFS